MTHTRGAWTFSAGRNLSCSELYQTVLLGWYRLSPQSTALLWGTKTWVWLSHNCVNFKFNYTAELPRRFRSRQVDVELDGQGCKTLERNRAGMPPVRGYRRGVAAGGNSPARFHPTQARRGSTLQGDYTNGAVRRISPSTAGR